MTFILQSVSGLQSKSLNWLSDLLNCYIFSYQDLQCSAHLNFVQLVEWGNCYHYFRIQELHDKNLLILYLKKFKLSKNYTIMIESHTYVLYIPHHVLLILRKAVSFYYILFTMFNCVYFIWNNFKRCLSKSLSILTHNNNTMQDLQHTDNLI